GNVPVGSGLAAGPVNPQWVSDSCTQSKSSLFDIPPAIPLRVVEQPSPEATTTPPIPANFKKSRRLMFNAIISLLNCDLPLTVIPPQAPIYSLVFHFCLAIKHRALTNTAAKGRYNTAQRSL